MLKLDPRHHCADHILHWRRCWRPVVIRATALVPVFALRMKMITSITDGRSYTEDLHRREHIYHHGRRVWGNIFMEEINTRKKERKRFMRTTVTLRNSCSKAFFFYDNWIYQSPLLIFWSWGSQSVRTNPVCLTLADPVSRSKSCSSWRSNLPKLLSI